MAKARRALYDRLGRRNGWITRRATSEGKNPDKVFNALKGIAERARRAEHAARVHGERARVKSEKRLTPSEKAKRTKDANRIERSKTIQRGRGRGADAGGFGDFGGEGSGAGGGSYGGGGGGSYDTLDDVYDDYGYDFDDGNEYDIETSPDYEEA